MTMLTASQGTLCQGQLRPFYPPFTLSQSHPLLLVTSAEETLRSKPFSFTLILTLEDNCPFPPESSLSPSNILPRINIPHLTWGRISSSRLIQDTLS